MRRFTLISACLVFTLGASGLMAKTYGPMKDLEAHVAHSQDIVGYPTEMFDGVSWYVVTDKLNVINLPDLLPWMYDIEMRGVGYVSSPDPTFTHGLVKITTIYGISPTGPKKHGFVITGFDPKRPFFKSIFETMHGKSGKDYRADKGKLVSISQLASELGGEFDLSPFQGDPNSQVYVFTTVMPAAEIQQPPRNVTNGADLAKNAMKPPCDDKSATARMGTGRDTSSNATRDCNPKYLGAEHARGQETQGGDCTNGTQCNPNPQKGTNKDNPRGN